MNAGKQTIKDLIVNFLIPIVSLVVSALLFFLIIFPTISSYTELSAEFDSKKQLEVQLKNKLSRLNELLDYKSVVDENAQLVKVILPSEASVPELLTQVDAIARDSGLEVNKLSYSFSDTSREGQVYESVSVTLGVDGTVAQLITFLKNLENSARIVNLDNIRYAVSSSESGNLVSSTLVLHAPYLYVESAAVTDDPISLSMSDEDFLELIGVIKGMKVYKLGTVIENIEELEEVEESTESVASVEESTEEPTE